MNKNICENYQVYQEYYKERKLRKYKYKRHKKIYNSFQEIKKSLFGSTTKSKEAETKNKKEELS
jgi:hypothetical protein